MRVRVCTVDGVEHEWDAVTVDTDTTVVQITGPTERVTFPLTSVLFYVVTEVTP